MSQVLSMTARRTVVDCQRGCWRGLHTWRGGLQGVTAIGAGFSGVLSASAGALKAHILMGAGPG